jgi:fatty-acyl-CoA synthase
MPPCAKAPAIALVMPERSGVTSIADLLAWRAAHGPDGPRICVLNNDREECWLSYEALWERARCIARGLHDRGVGPGQRIGLAMSTGLEFIETFFGCQIAGAVPVALAADQGGAGPRVAHIVARARLAFVLTGPGGVREPIDSGVEVLPIEAIRSERPLATTTPADTAFVQFTSGSTQAPRGVVIPQRAAIGNAAAIADAIQITDRDVSINWLPLSHDMGLVGTLLTPMMRGTTVILMPPELFISDLGRRFLRLVSAHGGTAWSLTVASGSIPFGSR